MQTIQRIDIETYRAARNPFDVVSRPSCNGKCGGKGKAHRHGTYERYVEDWLLLIARFVCSACGGHLSVLPSFALPYRNRLISKVDAYFLANDAERDNVSFGDLLATYWTWWRNHFHTVVELSGYPVGKAVRDPLNYWRALRSVAGGIEAAQQHLTSTYGISLLGFYACHKLG